MKKKTEKTYLILFEHVTIIYPYLSMKHDWDETAIYLGQ